MIVNEHEEINALIVRCLSGLASAEELSGLEKWMTVSDDNRKHFHQMKNVWDLSHPGLNPTEIYAEKALASVEKRINHRHSRSVILGMVRYAAAVLFLPLLALSFWLGSMNSLHMTGVPVYSEITAAFGTRSVLTLPDGSTVWLNSGSSLKYPRVFTSGTREVYLSGEGFFEVKANEKKPFIVHTRNLNVKATGTRFNVNASTLYAHTHVTLVSGKVTICKPVQGGKPLELAQMLPDQHLAFDTLSGDINISNGETYKYTAWKEGKLIFRNEPLEDVLKKIGYFYNVDMEIRDNSLKEYRYRATFEEESIEEIMNLLKHSSPVDYRVEKRKPLPDGSFPRKKIIIYRVRN